MISGKLTAGGVALLAGMILSTLAVGANAADITREELQSDTVNLVVDKGQVVDILKLLATQNGLNLSIPGNIEGSVTIALQDVSLVDALDVITAAVGTKWYISGNVIMVRPEAASDPREYETRLFRLQYIAATEARKVVEPMVPDGGKVETLSRSNAEGSGGWDEILEVVAQPERMRQIESIVEQVDRPRSLVEIEVRIIETSIRDETKLGLDFPDNVSLRVGHLPDELQVDGFGTRLLDHGKWTWGRMTASEVTFLLDFLIQKGNSKLISNPRVTTLSNQQAEIEVATTIPVQTLNRFSEGGVIQDIVSFQDLDVSINLLVTPRVSKDSIITLDVASNVEEITGYTGPPDNERPITSRRSVTSSVTVKNGESLGLGGLMKDVEHKTVVKLPILGSLPLLGRLFQHHSTSKEKAELLILITPHIMQSP